MATPATKTSGTADTSGTTTKKTKESIFKEVDLLYEKNNCLHHTDEISVTELIVRRGQSFDVNVTLKETFNPRRNTIILTAETGSKPSQELGTLSVFSIPDGAGGSPSAKVVWKVELHKDSSPSTGKLVLSITPPVNAPIGKYLLNLKHKEKEELITELVVLFNPWCPDDSVYMGDKKERDEYVMNEQGVIYRGSKNKIYNLNWDLAQFEDDMVPICLKILDLNPKCLKDPAADVAARSDPVYVSRVVSAMINFEDDKGVLEGRWEGSYSDGFRPTHWNGSYTILKLWYENDAKAVKYGQCWVFAGVMCSVMRLLGIPCRIVTNFESAHDNNKNLVVEKYYTFMGYDKDKTKDSVWNFHVWVEGWMARPDLSDDGRYNGWQVLDATPQTISDGVYCLGPVPTIAILNGETDVKYDAAYVFAEVNADCKDWLVMTEDIKYQLCSDCKRVGQCISTKAVGSKNRLDITGTYKQKEGTEKERSVFDYAQSRDYPIEMEPEETEEEEHSDDEMHEHDENAETGEIVVIEDVTEGEESDEPDDDEEMEEDAKTGGTEGNMAGNETTVFKLAPAPPPVVMRVGEVTPPRNGKDVRLKLILECEVARKLSVNISVQAMVYNCSSVVKIQTEKREATLEPKKALSIPIRVPFSVYHTHMVEADVMRVNVVATDIERLKMSYLAEDDVVLIDPPISVKVFGKVRKGQEAKGEVLFQNPADQTLTGCKLSISGSGLLKDEIKQEIQDIKPSTRIRVKFSFVPYKIGKKKVLVDFDCASFRDVKGTCTVNVKQE